MRITRLQFVFMAAWRQRNDAIAISKAAIVPQLSGGIVVRRFGGGPIQLFPNPNCAAAPLLLFHARGFKFNCHLRLPASINFGDATIAAVPFFFLS
ncbi:hypothetical protein CDAR_242171 [Caerostris darwini]|uniref:Secreted protein n=1 Tax=Caerostris darwini TaxID=1538125 RepID=A0AAV4NN75_9ARAC|nr:hypothetical protein CDAR_242171 [Caerostris darwini]